MGFFELTVSLAGMAPEDGLSVVLPEKFAGGTLSELLAHVFSAGDAERRWVSSMFDLRANPDLPEIYAVFLDAFDQWRKGRCTLLFSNTDGLVVDVSGLVSQHLLARTALGPVPLDDKGGSAAQLGDVDGSAIGGGRSEYPALQIRIEQQYSAVDHASRLGPWRDKEELLEWLRCLTVLYFMDKHGAAIAPSVDVGPKAVLGNATDDLRSQRSIAIPQGAQTFAITAKGRGFITRLLVETESYIDLYDHFKDTCHDWDFSADEGAPDEGAPSPDSIAPDSIRFGVGQGVDLRVQVFEAEGLDPFRTVFLLRLYDGTLDEFVSTWQGLIQDEAFFNGILEPVLNRAEAAEGMIARIVESGYAYLEEREERSRELESQQAVIDRAWG